MSSGLNSQIPLPRILVYQDEDCSIMVDYLRFYGFDVITSTENDIEAKIKSRNYDLCILGHYRSILPGDLKLLKLLREIDNKCPIVFVSDQSHYSYVLQAFDEGADDYIIRPYNLEELIRRVKALLKRCGIKVRAIESVYQIGKYVFNTENSTLISDDIEIRLMPRESKTLALLCAYKNEVLPRKILMRHVWTDDNYFNKRSLDVYMHNLRNYLKADKRISIETIRAVGYSLTVNSE